MELNYQTASFFEMVVVNSKQVAKSNFDIILDEEITLQNYCCKLINKILELLQSDFSAFINYQSHLVREPLIWLNKFEELIANNKDHFIGKRALTRYNKLFNIIVLKRKELQFLSINETKKNTPKKYINAENDDRYFSFYELKKQLENTICDNEKILLLTKEKHEYRQSNIEFINQKTPLFDEQCSKEIEQIYELGKLKSDFEKTKPNHNNNQNPFNKIQFNCNVNQFVDIFYQLHRELFIDGKPIIDGNINDMVTMIVNSFIDKDKNEISPQTVETIMKPSRGDKRPKLHKRIDIDKML